MGKQAVIDGIGLPTDITASIGCTALAALAEKQGFQDLRDWARRQVFVRGVSNVTVSEVVFEIGCIIHRQRAFGPNRPWKRRVMTIHQAKNREFESVIILWPLKQAGNLERKRRLLYNAVTRARGRAVLIVEDPKRKVMAGPLFTGGNE